LAIVKSKLLKQLHKNWPYILHKDLEKFFDIIIKEIKESLKRQDRVEFRGFGTWATNIQKSRVSRNPRTGQKVDTPEKLSINFKISKELSKKINNEET
tara:strand:+ start:329 stop:622 length:294 start_codon:yes stop_codon:yes gene_type:complete